MSDESLPQDPPRVAIAAVLNRMREAIVAGDGEAACELMTPRGRQFFTRAGQVSGVAPGAADCVSAVETATERAPEPQLESLSEELEPTDVSLGRSQLPGARSAGDAALPARERQAEVNCPFRGGYGVARTGEDWRVFMPVCFD